MIASVPAGACSELSQAWLVAAWKSLHSAETAGAFAFSAQLLEDTQTIDLHLRLQMTERVLVRHNEATGLVTAAHHLPEPGPIGFADKPERWQLDLLHPDGERQTLGTFDGPALPRARQYLDALGIPRA